MKSVRPIRIEGDVAYVPLTQGQEAIIDASDVNIISSRSWRADKRKDGGFYAAITKTDECGVRKTVRMHTLIAVFGAGIEVDHINRNGLDNRRVNLRSATRSQNEHNKSRYKNNTSGYKGVTWDKSNNKWVAQITFNGKRHGLGYYKTIEAAHNAYCIASKNLHGEFSRVV